MNYLGTTDNGHQFAVEASLKSGGVDAYVFREVTHKRRGKDRYARTEIAPLYATWIFAQMTPEQFHQAQGIKHLRSTWYCIRSQEAARIAEMREQNERAVESAQAAVSAADRLSEFKEGERVDLVSGPLQGHTAVFQSIREELTGLFPKLVLELDVMGQVIEVAADPLDVRRAV